MVFRPLFRFTTLILYSEALSVSVFHSAEHGSGSFERDHSNWRRTSTPYRKYPSITYYQNNLRLVHKGSHQINEIGYASLLPNLDSRQILTTRDPHSDVVVRAIHSGGWFVSWHFPSTASDGLHIPHADECRCKDQSLFLGKCSTFAHRMSTTCNTS
jgi:hypothetical protein